MTEVSHIFRIDVFRCNLCMFVYMFVRLLTASDWLKYTHNLSNTIKLILLDSLLQDDTAGAIIQGVFLNG